MSRSGVSLVARAWLVVALVALAACVPGLLNDFVYDDQPIIRDNVRLHDLANWGELLTRPYWPPPFVEQLYRPVAILLLAVEYALGGGRPIVFRLVSYALYVGCSIGVFRLASRILSPTASLAVAVLFAAHPVHVEAVALGVNQGEIIVAMITLAMTTLYLDARRAGRPGFGRWCALTLLYAIAALTKENGFVLPGLLICVELTLVPGKSMRTRLSETAGGYAALAAVGMMLVMLRASVLPDAIAVIPAVDLRGMGLGERAMAMFQIVPTWLRLLSFPATLRVDYHLTVVALQTIALTAVGLALVFAAFVVAYRARHSAPVVTFGIGWCVVTLLPVSNLIPTGILVAERTLFLPSVGFLIAVGGAATALVQRQRTPVLAQRLIALCAILTALGIVKSAVRELSWNSANVRVVATQRGKP